MTIENPPAFPQHPGIQIDGASAADWHGMSLRDWFAGQAMAGFLADGGQRLVNEAYLDDPNFLDMEPAKRAHVVNEQIALGFYALADAMLASRLLRPLQP